MWRYSGLKDWMRLACEDLPSSLATKVMVILFGRCRVSIPSDDASPLFLFSDGKEPAVEMPMFDEHGPVRSRPKEPHAKPSGTEPADRRGVATAAKSSTLRGGKKRLVRSKQSIEASSRGSDRSDGGETTEGSGGDVGSDGEGQSNLVVASFEHESVGKDGDAEEVL